jgi:hypothetical protein
MMTSGHNGEAVLALARELRHAVSERQAAMAHALHAYNHAGGHRLDYAAAFLKAVQRAESAYEEISREALKTYREAIQEQ